MQIAIFHILVIPQVCNQLAIISVIDRVCDPSPRIPAIHHLEMDRTKTSLRFSIQDWIARKQHCDPSQDDGSQLRAIQHILLNRNTFMDDGEYMHLMSSSCSPAFFLQAAERGP
jgi:hypothetical protein